jgi:hypothetical protein
MTLRKPKSRPIRKTGEKSWGAKSFDSRFRNWLKNARGYRWGGFGITPKDRPIDAVDQSDFFLGKSDKSNREGFLVFVADRLKSKKRSFRGVPRDSGGAGSSFEKASERIVRINVDGRAWLKLGAAIAHYGDIEFKRLPAVFPKGFGNQESGDEGLAGADPTCQEEGLAPDKEF